MSNTAELKARQWLAGQLAWEHRLEELRAAAGVEGSVSVEATEASEVDGVDRRDRSAA